MTALEHLILTVLTVQSPGYLCSHDAAAFMAEGLDSTEVLSTLKEMETQGFVEFYVEEEQVDRIKVERDQNEQPILNDDGSYKFIADDTGKPLTETVAVLADSGWIVTAKGVTAMENAFA